MLEVRMADATDDLAIYTRKLYNATGFLAVLTAGLVFFGSVQIGDAKKTGRAARESADAAIRALGLSRPWFGTPHIVATDKSADACRLVYTVKNIGRTPARGLYIAAAVATLDYKKQSADMRRAIIADIADLEKSERWRKQHFVAPSDTFVLDKPNRVVKVNVSRTDLAECSEGEHIVGCIAYGEMEGNAIHMTTFVVKLHLESLKVRRVWTLNVS